MKNKRFVFPHDFSKNVEYQEQVSLYHESILPIIFVLRIFGVYPYEKRDGVVNFRYKSWIFVYSIALYFLHFNVAIKTISSCYRDYKREIYDLVQIYIIVCLSVIPFCTPPLIWISGKKLETFFKGWTTFQNRYSLVMQSPLKCEQTKWNIIKNTIIFVITYCSLFVVVDIVNLNYFHVIFCITCALFHSLFMTLYVMTMRVFKVTMNDYKKQMKNAMVSKYLGVRMMEEYRLIWVTISRLVQEFGACFSLTLTLHLIIHSVMFVLLVYHLVGLTSQYVKMKYYYKFLKLFVAPWIPFAMIYVCCNIGHLITKHCIEDIPELIVEMKSNQIVFNNDNSIPIRLFLYAVNDFKPTVNILGYFEINRPLFGSIISVLVTYMIVLVQFGNN